MASSRKGISNTLATLVVLTVIAGLCWFGARFGADFIENRSEANVRSAMIVSGQDWVQVQSEGLQVKLSGTAPDEAGRFRAVTEAGKVVDASRLVDEITIAAAEEMVAPEFKVELLRNDEGISLIGLIPAATDPGALVKMLESETAAPKITDLLEQADYPAPEGWEEAVDFAMRAAQLSRRSKISVSPGEVDIAILADSRDEQGRLEAELTRLTPKGVRLKTEISAPRPVITPFTLRFLMDEQGARFDACAADKEEGRKRILDAAVRAGVTGKAGCTLALGSPSPEWADAAVASIGAVAALGRGTITMSDADITLIVPAAVERETFDKAVGNLEQALPDVFTLHSELEAAPEGPAGPAEFAAILSPDRSLNMRGRVTGEKMEEVVDSFARARFAKVEGNLRNDQETPSGWTVRVVAALEALDGLRKGSIMVTPEMIAVTGDSGDPLASDTTASVLSKRLGPGARYQLSIRYDRRLDPALALPSGHECVRRLNNIMAEATIGFEPNKSTIAGDPSETLERFSQAMEECSEFQIEAGGHTDSQGSEGFNADLSRSRAQAIVAAMDEEGINTANMTSRGYGESRPIASNETEQGREENRRIEFRLVSAEPIRSEPLAAPATVAGVTKAIDSGPEVEPVMNAAPATNSGPEKGGDDLAAPATEAKGKAGTQLPSEPDTAEAAVSSEAVTDPGNGADAETEADQKPDPGFHPAEREKPAAPSTVGASEQYEPLDVREENLRLPVQTPDDDTPRPLQRPDADEEGESQ